MLTKTQQGWIFVEERLLEDFVWENLESTLDLIPMHRQFCVKGEYCDILARTQNRQLAILELKNCEDRYVIHQLTRYYHGLQLEKPFKDIIDYDQPIRLIAIAPDFHRHNFIDRHYSTLKFEFIRFSILSQESQDNCFYLHFHLPGRKETTVQEPIPFTHVEPEQEEIAIPEIKIDPPPRMLLNFLDKLSPVTKTEILRLREKMLAADRRIKEIKDGKNVFYGRGKTKPCCQLKFIPATPSFKFNFIRCYLWLPLPKRHLRYNQASGIGRMHLDLQSDFKTIRAITYWPGKSRSANNIGISLDLYLEEINRGHEKLSIDDLFDLAIKLNLERK